MTRIKSNWYTKGKFDRKNWRNTLDTENEFLYSKGRYWIVNTFLYNFYKDIFLYSTGVK